MAPIRLTGLTISNLECFGIEPTYIPITPYTLVLGGPKTGKTAIVRALDLHRIVYQLYHRRNWNNSEYYIPIDWFSKPHVQTATEPISLTSHWEYTHAPGYPPPAAPPIIKATVRTTFTVVADPAVNSTDALGETRGGSYRFP